MKKTLIILLSLSLVACGLNIAETPEEALAIFDASDDTFRMTKILGTDTNNEKKGYYVFEAEVDNQTKWYVAKIVTNDLYWYVKESVSIGIPKDENESYSVESKTFITGISHKKEEKKGREIMITIPDSANYVWIEQYTSEK